MKESIFFIVDHLRGGGAERINLDLAEKFIRDGFDVHMALLDGADIGMDIPQGLNVINLDITFNSRLYRAKGKSLNEVKASFIKNTIESLNPRLVIIGYYIAFWLVPYCGERNIWCWVHSLDFNFFDIAHRVSEKGILNYLSEWRRIYMEKKGFRHLFSGQNIIVVNDELGEFFKSYSNPRQIKTIMNGVCRERIAGFDARKEKPIYDAIYVGRLTKEKQPEVAIKAFAQSKLTGKLAIVGDGEEKDNLLKLVTELNVMDRVEFLGWQTKPEKIISKSRMLLLTSKRESFGLVVAEALLLNVPVVAYNCSSGLEYQLNSEALRRGLVESDNFDQLVDRINEIYDFPYVITEEDKARLGMDVMYKKFKALLT